MQSKQFLECNQAPVYCGKILIPKFKEEEPLIVEGQHEPIISESLFDEVRDVISGRKKINAQQRLERKSRRVLLLQLYFQMRSQVQAS